MLLLPDNHKTGCQHNSDDSTVNLHCHENLNSRLCRFVFVHFFTHWPAVFHCWVLNSFTSAVYWSHCAVTLSSLGLLFFFFGTIVALFLLTDIIFHFCGVCVHRLLLLFLLLFDVTGVGVRCRLLPDINATAARYC